MMAEDGYKTCDFEKSVFAKLDSIISNYLVKCLYVVSLEIGFKQDTVANVPENYLLPNSLHINI